MLEKIGTRKNEELLGKYLDLKNRMGWQGEELNQIRDELFKRAGEKGVETGKGHRLLKIGKMVFKREVRRTIGFTHEAKGILLDLEVLNEAVDMVLSRKKVEKLIEEERIPRDRTREIFMVVKEVFIPKVLEEIKEEQEE